MAPGPARRGLWASPVVQTLAAMGVVFAAQLALAAAGRAGVLALSAGALAERPWTLATGVYAHAGPGHLLANAVALALVGPLVSRRTSRARFHAFFLATGALSALAQVAVGGLFGPAPAVLGASGAVFALAGYMLSGNVVTSAVLDRLRLSWRVQAVLLLAVVVALTLATGSSRVALVAHATGLVVGAVAGRLKLLDRGGSRRAAGAQGH